MNPAAQISMGAKTHRELVAWQLADEIRRSVIEITAHSSTSKDFKFCDQLRSAASSVAANVAEGFGRRSPKDFARFLAIAKGSLAETQDRIRDGVARGYFAEPDAAALIVLTARCSRVITNLRAYLLTCTSER